MGGVRRRAPSGVRQCKCGCDRAIMLPSNRLWHQDCVRKMRAFQAELNKNRTLPSKGIKPICQTCWGMPWRRELICSGCGEPFGEERASGDPGKGRCMLDDADIWA